LSKKQIISELEILSKRIVNVVRETEIKNTLKKGKDFENMLISCQDTTNPTIYCKKKKLIITKDKLNELLEIMASDILNPYKSKWLFNMFFSNNIINYFRFIYRPAEHINITIE
jgi:hypothetical protein